MRICSLIRIFTAHILDSFFPADNDDSDQTADAKIDLSFLWAHVSESTFSRLTLRLQKR